VVIGEQGEILLVNRQVEQLFGYGRDELVGQPVEVLIPEAARDAHRSHRGRYGRLRSSIFALNTTSLTSSLRAKVLDVCADERHALGSDASVRFAGPVDTVDDSVGEDLFSMLREALSNVARHAHARSVQVTVEARDGQRLRVEDDGIGPPAEGDRRHGGRGLGNMAARADQLGGEFTLERGTPGGTLLTWTVPLEPRALTLEPR
jgi:two-component system, NarL family, sensor histidine kinase DevS